MSITISVIILLIVIFIWYMWFLQKKNAGLLNGYKDQMQDLQKDRFKDKIEELANMNLAGASQNRFISVKKDYDEQLKDIVPSLSTDIRKAEYMNSQFKVFGSRKQLKKVDERITVIKDEFNEIEDSLDNLSKSNEQNAIQGEELRKSYQILRKKVLTQSFDYGAAAEKLEDELSEVADLLDKEAEYTKQGDHLEAGQYLDDARIKITLITDQLKVIEPLQHSLSNVYPGQIEEINQTYQKLLNQKFKFTEDVATLIKEVQDNMLKAGDALGELNFDNVNSISEDIGSEIDHLYDLLGKEIEAKQGVLKQQKPVLDYINHARFQHNRLDIRVQDLEEHYILKKDDLDLIKKNLNSLNRLREDYDQDVQDIADKEVIFSKAEQNFQKAIIELDKIEKSEKDVNDNFNQMITSEGIAKNSVDEYAKKLEIQKKMVEQLRLNGLPDDYLDYFYMVYDEIKKLYDELDSKRINMEEISKQVIVAQEDLENLVQKTTELKKQVVLSEKLLQYANRYVDHDDDYNDQLAKSRSLFDDDYNYEKSLEVISKQLERVEPGSVERIKDSISD